MFWKLFCACIVVFLSTVEANIVRCDLIDPHSKESELCWKQLLYKNYPQLPQMAVDANADAPVPVHGRNAELSSALMQLYGYNKLNGKRNPELSRDVMRFMSDASPYKEN